MHTRTWQVNLFYARDLKILHAKAEAASRRQAMTLPREVLPPAVWRSMSEVERLQHLWGRSLDDVLELSQVGWHEARPDERASKLRIFEVFVKYWFKAAARQVEASEEEKRRLEELRRRLGG